MYAEFPHPSKQRGAIDAQACGCAIITANPPLAFRKCPDNGFALLSSVLGINTFFVIERIKSLFHYARNLITVVQGWRLHRLVHADPSQFSEWRLE